MPSSSKYCHLLTNDEILQCVSPGYFLPESETKQVGKRVKRGACKVAVWSLFFMVSQGSVTISAFSNPSIFVPLCLVFSHKCLMPATHMFIFGCVFSWHLSKQNVIGCLTVVFLFKKRLQFFWSNYSGRQFDKDMKGREFYCCQLAVPS